MIQSTRLQVNDTRNVEIQHASLESELNLASRIDPGLVHIISLAGYPEPRTRSSGFSTLVEIINAQQLSTKSASAIWNRLEILNRGTVTPRKIINCTRSQLRECGLSERKTSYVRNLADMMLSGDLDLDVIEKLPDQQVICKLTRIKGIGTWSAEIYAMFALGRVDIFPANDLALQVALQRYELLANRPDEKQTRKISAKWSPHRTAVALLMWKFYGAAALD